MQEVIIVRSCCRKGTNLIQGRTSRQYIDFITILSVLNSKTRVKMPVSSDPRWFYVVSNAQTGFVQKPASGCQVAAQIHCRTTVAKQLNGFDLRQGASYFPRGETSCCSRICVAVAEFVRIRAVESLASEFLRIQRQLMATESRGSLRSDFVPGRSSKNQPDQCNQQNQCGQIHPTWLS